MELKPYQQQVITDLENFLEFLDRYDDTASAFNKYWEEKVGAYQLNVDGSFTGMVPYKNNIPNAIHIAMKVPTAGGKTLIACSAIQTFSKHLEVGRAKAVVWLVPWSNLLQQTVGALSDPSHPYREKLNSMFSNRIEVYEKEQLLLGENFNPSSLTEQLNIFVFSFSSIRIDSKKKDDRKVFQENGALESFKEFVDESFVLPNTDETALINIIRSLNPIVIVDESHNAESDLSVEMLNNLNPSFVLDLTATPKQNSNIVSYVNAIALKKENMVKLPVIVYNHHKKEEVISSALHLRKQLEQLATEERENTGKYIRPIILFQAQSNIKGKDNTTFDKIKAQLVKLKIPEEQIKIKVSGNDELKGVDLMAEDCPVRYIITVNALKEGWDCPFAYILASLADKSSAVDVEQILGRVLRQPYVTKHKSPLLNLSYVLTASSKFKDTLDNIVKGLQESGFSKHDYYAEEAQEVEESDDEVLQKDLFGEDSSDYGEAKSDDEFDTTEISFDPEVSIDKDDKSTLDETVTTITEKATEESEAFEAVVNSTTEDNTDFLLREMGKDPAKYKIEAKFQEAATSIKIPQFFRKVDEAELHDTIVFEELNQEDQLLSKISLLDGFKLSSKSTDINFDETSAEVYKVDVDEDKNTVVIDKVRAKSKDIFIRTILAKPQDNQLTEISKHIVGKLGDMTPISHDELKKYVARIFENSLTNDQVADIINNEFIYIQKIKKKIGELTSIYAREKFLALLDTNSIFVKPHFEFKESLTHLNLCSPIAKSLYEREGSVNGFEQDVIMEIAALENVVFWHRNLERGKGFALNGYDSNHYPDFIIYTSKCNLILLETKGDDRDNDDSSSKNVLGKKWAEKAGEHYKYFMVFQKKEVQNTYTASSIMDILKQL